MTCSNLTGVWSAAHVCDKMSGHFVADVSSRPYPLTLGWSKTTLQAALTKLQTIPKDKIISGMNCSLTGIIILIPNDSGVFE